MSVPLLPYTSRGVELDQNGAVEISLQVVRWRTGVEQPREQLPPTTARSFSTTLNAR